LTADSRKPKEKGKNKNFKKILFQEDVMSKGIEEKERRRLS
jgi:hypothetical protein